MDDIPRQHTFEPCNHKELLLIQYANRLVRMRALIREQRALSARILEVDMELKTIRRINNKTVRQVYLITVNEKGRNIRWIAK